MTASTKAKSGPKYLMSPSGMGAFFTCQRKLYYQQRWRPTKVERFFTDGTDTHRIMEGKRLDHSNVRAQQFANKLKRLMGTRYRLVPRWQEKTMLVVSPDGSIGIKQTIDSLAEDQRWDDPPPVIIDYKTGTWPWWVHGDKERTNRIVPKAAGTPQSVAYLLPRPLPRNYPFDEWPDEIHYLNAPENGAPDIYTYKLQQGDIDNFWIQAEVVAEAMEKNRFPYTRGYHCRFCPFIDKCFGREKRGQYKRREDGPPMEDDEQ